MIDYIGDISINDAEVLKELAKNAVNILEFGAGASTQVLAYYTKGDLITVETNPGWIEKTAANIARLGIPAHGVYYKTYKQFQEYPEGPYDLIFDDGVDSLRLDFAQSSWKLLKVGGTFCFHDTRRSSDVKNVCMLLELFSPEIHTIIMNKDHSNITTILKKKAEFYENWNEVEEKELWQYGK